MDRDQRGKTQFVVRRSAPWPLVRCKACGGSRHYQAWRSSVEWDETEMDMVKFALAHKHCG